MNVLAWWLVTVQFIGIGAPETEPPALEASRVEVWRALRGKDIGKDSVPLGKFWHRITPPVVEKVVYTGVWNKPQKKDRAVALFQGKVKFEGYYTIRLDNPKDVNHGAVKEVDFALFTLLTVVKK